MTQRRELPRGRPARPPKAPRWLKPTVDFGPLAVFFGTYWLTGLMPATAALIAATLIVLVVSLAVERRVPLMPVITAIVVGIFGGLTLWLRDDTFIKIKPTIVMGLMAVVLLGGLALGKALLKPLLGAAWPMDDAGWRALTLRFGLFYIALALLNEAVWRTQTEAFWVSFKVFGITGLTLVFALAQAPMMTRHRTDVPDDPEGSTR